MNWCYHAGDTRNQDPTHNNQKGSGNCSCLRSCPFQWREVHGGRGWNTILIPDHQVQHVLDQLKVLTEVMEALPGEKSTTRAQHHGEQLGIQERDAISPSHSGAKGNGVSELLI